MAMLDKLKEIIIFEEKIKKEEEIYKKENDDRMERIKTIIGENKEFYLYRITSKCPFDYEYYISFNSNKELTQESILFHVDGCDFYRYIGKTPMERFEMKHTIEINMYYLLINMYYFK